MITGRLLTHQIQLESQENCLRLLWHRYDSQARSGKLDPVVGRDNQIRRVITILNRRTKNNPYYR